MTVGEPAPPPADQPVPRLPRGRWFRISRADLFRIGMFTTLLIAVIALRRPCADGVASFVGSYEPDAAPSPRPPTLRYEHLSEEQIRQRFPRGAIDAGVAPAR